MKLYKNLNKEQKYIKILGRIHKIYQIISHMKYFSD
jgi:hypothetical protein